MSKLLDPTMMFYEASQNFSNRLSLLPHLMAMKYDHLLNPDVFHIQYRKKIAPFMQLTGDEVTRKHFQIYHHIYSTVSDELMPAVDVLKTEWYELQALRPVFNLLQMEFAAKCKYVVDMMEEEVILHAGVLKDEIEIHPT